MLQATTVTVESGAFTVTSTVGGSDAANGEGQLGGASAAAAAGSSRKTAVNAPSPRFGAAMAIKQGTLYLFGGSVEDGDVTYTLKDLYSIGKLLNTVNLLNLFVIIYYFLQTFTSSTSGRR